MPIQSVISAMLALLLAACASEANHVDRRDISRAVRKELYRMYMMQTLMGQYAPYFMMFGGHHGFPLFNGENAGSFDFEELFSDDDDENIEKKDVARAVRRELQRMYMLQYFFSQMPTPQMRNFENFQEMNQFPFAANLNEDYDYYDYDDDYYD